MTKESLYNDWLTAKKNLTKFKTDELKLRNEIIQTFIDNEVSGNLKFQKGHYKITIGLSLNNQLDESVLNTIWEDLSDEEKNCIKYKPSLIAKDFKELSGNEKLFEAITIKPRQSTLKIEVLE